MENAGEEILSLRRLLAGYERLYRLENAPAISDAQYDSLMRRLRELEAAHPEFADASSPSVSVGDDSSPGFDKRPHLSKMLSLDNAFTLDELREFDERLRKALGKEGPLAYEVEPKIDGAGISAVYENGRLSRLLTRGNGSEGDDITRNISVFKNIPLSLAGPRIPSLLEVRGEAYMLNSDFEAMRARQEAENAELEQEEFEGAEGARQPRKKAAIYANPRNLAAGTMKLLDKTALEGRSLYASFYSLGKVLGAEVSRQSLLAEFLESLGLPSLSWRAAALGIEEVYERIVRLDSERRSFDFNTDGAVVKLDDMSLYALAGWTSKAPRWAVAWKYRPARAEVVIYDITLQVGRTGAVTPVAELEDASRPGSRLPVQLSGSSVSRATLHNFDEIARRDIRVGDTASVEKAGEIIPAVVTVFPGKRGAGSLPFKAPERCPACGSALVRDVSEAILRCINPECPEQMRRRIIHFASRGCMDIEGLGEAVVTQLADLGLVGNCADIYSLSADGLLRLRNFKQKSVDNLLKAIAESRSRDLWRLVFGLGIPYVGERVAKDLAASFKTLDALAASDIQSLSGVPGVGEKIVYSVLEFFRSGENLKIIEKLRACGLNFSARGQPLSGALSGKIFAFTGTLKTMGRSEAKRLVESYGGRSASSVSSATDFLVAAGAASSKLEKARLLGVKTISEDEFLAMLESAKAGVSASGADSDAAPPPASPPPGDDPQMTLF